MGIERDHIDGSRWLAFDNLAAAVQDVALPNLLVVSPQILALPLFNGRERILSWCNPLHDCIFVPDVGLLCVPLRICKAVR